MRAKDLAGNVDASPATQTFSVDTTAPWTTSDYDGFWHSGPLTVTLTGHDAGVGVDYTEYSTDDGASWTTGTKVDVSAEGETTVLYYSTDKLGHVEDPAQSVTVKIDTTRPTVSDDYDGLWHNGDVLVTLDPQDSGGSGFDKTYYKVDDDPLGFTQGTSFTVKGQGQHAVEYYTTDVAGNESAHGNIIVKIDTTKPTASASATPSPNGSGWNNSDVTVNANGTDLGGSGVDATTWQWSYTKNGGSTPVTGSGASVPLSAEGTYVVSFTVSDVAGNTSLPSAPVTVKIDESPPATIMLSGPSGWTSSRSATFTWTGSDNKTTTSDLVYSYKLDGAAWSSWASATSRAYSGLSEGNHTFSVKAKDLAGNEAPSPATRTFSVDTTAPWTTNDYDGLWHNGPLTVTLTGHDAGVGVDFTKYSTDGGTSWTKGTSVDVSAEGETTVLYYSTDLLGNVETPAKSVTVKIDTTAPDTTITGGPSGWTASDNAVFTWTGSDDKTATGDLVYSYKLDDGDWSGWVAATSHDFSGLSEGSHTFSVRAKDLAGNVDATPATRTFSVFTSGPVIDAPDINDVEATGPSGAAVTLAATATDPVDDSTPVTYWLGTTEIFSGDTFSLGVTTVTAKATDSLGNSASADFTVTVVDTTAPEISGVPADMTLEATSAAGAIATWDTPTASDLVDDSVDVSCDADSGDTFPLGETTVTVSATDANGNTATDSFTVTVVDTTAPQISGVPKDMTLEATSADGAIATWDTPTASDLVDGSVDVSCDADSGDTFPLGQTTVTVSATDTAGNTATKSFTVTVVDTTAPAISVPADMTLEATSADWRHRHLGYAHRL